MVTARRRPHSDRLAIPTRERGRELELLTDGSRVRQDVPPDQFTSAFQVAEPRLGQRVHHSCGFKPYDTTLAQPNLDARLKGLTEVTLHLSKVNPADLVSPKSVADEQGGIRDSHHESQSTPADIPDERGRNDENETRWHVERRSHEKRDREAEEKQ